MSIWDIFKKKGSDTSDTGGNNSGGSGSTDTGGSGTTDVSGSASNAPVNVKSDDSQESSQKPLNTQTGQEGYTFTEQQLAEKFPEAGGEQPLNDNGGEAPTIQKIGPEIFMHTVDQDGVLKPAGSIQTPAETPTEQPQPQSNAPGLQVAQQFLQQNPELVQSMQQQSQGGQQEQQSQQAGPDWSQGFMKVIENGYNGSILQGIQEYNQWAADNGKQPLDAFTTYPLLQKYDATKSLEQNQKDEKKAKRQETWQQIGSVLSHVGNLVGTIMGAPEQKLISGAELTDRQLKLKDYTLQQRRQGLGDLMNLYYKDRADQRAGDLNRINIEYKQQQAALAKEKAAQEKELATLQQERVKAQIAGDQVRAAQLEADVRKKEAEIERLNKLVPSEIAKNEAAASASRANASAAYARANATNKANEDWIDEAEQWGDLYPDEYAEWKKQNQIETGKKGTKGIDKKNPEVFVKRMRTKHGTIQKAKQAKANNTPPSRRKQTSNTNVPPSRRK